MKRPSDEDVEILQEVVEDLDYFYEDEIEEQRNIKIVRKLKRISIALAVFTLLIIIFVTGLIQMNVYNTKKIVTKDLMTKKDYISNIDEYYDYARDFYVVKEVNGVEQVSGTFYAIEVLYKQNGAMSSETDELANDILDMYDDYISSKSYIIVPDNDTYESFNDNLDLLEI